MKEYKSTYKIKRDPFWGKCDSCGCKDILVIKGGPYGLRLICSKCNELNNFNKVK